MLNLFRFKRNITTGTSTVWRRIST